MQRDLSQVKADVMQEEKFDVAKVHDEITELEKRVSCRGKSEMCFQGCALFAQIYVARARSCFKKGVFQPFCSLI